MRGETTIATAAPWLLVTLFVAIGFHSVSPPGALPADAPASDFSAARAMVHIAAMAKEPHPMGSPALARVRAHLVSELEKLGLQPERQTFTAPDYFGSAGTVEVVNVLARIPGTSNTRAIALIAHYDTVPAAPGANDNTACVATLIETARALLSGPPVANDTILLFTDGEEPAPRYGATAFIDRHPAAGEIGFVVNFEAAGGSGPSMLAETSGSEAWVVGEYTAAVPHPVAFSFVGELVKLMGDMGTDFDAFRNAGVPGIHVAYIRGSPIYHTAADKVGSVSANSLQHHGEHAIGIVRHVGQLDLTATPEEAASVYFTLRPFFVQYPARWSVVLALLALALFGWAVFRSEVRLGAAATGCGLALLAVLLATLAATAAWMLLASLRSTPSAIESYAYLLALVALGAALEMKLTARMRPNVRAAGYVLLWVVLALATATAAPGMSYLFVWPALAAAVALVWPVAQRHRLLRFALVAAPALVLVTPAVEFFFQMGQPRPGNPDSSVPVVAAGAVLLATLVAGLLRGVLYGGDLRTGTPSAHLARS